MLNAFLSIMLVIVRANIYEAGFHREEPTMITLGIDYHGENWH